MAIELSGATVNRIARMFPLADQELVCALLTDECGDNLPLVTPANSVSLERIRFAVLKLSGGDLNTLQRAIELAKIDWRDVLVEAGFSRDVAAHHSWWPDTPTRQSRR